jgi:hypothetical protein
VQRAAVERERMRHLREEPDVARFLLEELPMIRSTHAVEVPGADAHQSILT